MFAHCYLDYCNAPLTATVDIHMICYNKLRILPWFPIICRKKVSRTIFPPVMKDAFREYSPTTYGYG